MEPFQESPASLPGLEYPHLPVTAMPNSPRPMVTQLSMHPSVSLLTSWQRLPLTQLEVDGATPLAAPLASAPTLLRMVTRCQVHKHFTRVAYGCSNVS